MSNPIASEASVEGLYLCFAAREEPVRPMSELAEVFALEGLGLVATTAGHVYDRYCLREDGGTWHHDGWYQTRAGEVRNVSLIAMEDIETAKAERELEKLGPYEAHETRRNIVTRGVRLNELLGVRFRVVSGDSAVEMVGTELCHPCNRPDELSGKTDFQRFFRMRGGLRATLLTSGVIAVGDRIELV